MKIMVIGLGSMGKRRIRLIKQINPRADIIGVDGRSDRRSDAKDIYGIRCFESLDQGLDSGCESVFICTPPLSHGHLISACLQKKKHVFSEINLVDDWYEENMQLAIANGCVLFLSSTFLYRAEIRYIMNEVKQAESLLSYTYHVGQYLPDWHPWEDYTQFFVGDKRSSGCRELMAIEFPWIIKTFGKIISWHVKKNKKTKLKISYNDSYLLLVEHENGVQGTIMFDVVSRKAVRNLEIYGEDLYLTWDGTANGLKQLDIESKQEKQISLYETIDQQNDYAAFVVENAYRNEIEAFFRQIAEGDCPPYAFADDREILHLIDQIEG